MSADVEQTKTGPAARLWAKLLLVPRRLTIVVLVVAALWFFGFRGEFDLAYVVAGLLIGVAAWQRITVPANAPYSFDLPGMPDGPAAIRAVLPPPSNSYALLVALAAFALGSLFLLPGWIVLIATVAVLLVWLVAIIAVFQRLRQIWRLVRALKAYSPEIGIGFAGRGGGPWQLMMWEPYLLRSGLPCVIYSRNETHVKMIREGSDLKSPFIQLSPDPVGDLNRLLVPSLRTLYYVQNAKNNQEFMSHTNLTHVWLNHGDSDKPANFNPRHANYDKLVVCGQAGIDRYERHGIHVDPEKFAILGRPQAANVIPASGSISAKDKQVLLYAPTWQGVNKSLNFSSLDCGTEIIKRLIARDVTVIFRPHPLSLRWKGRRLVCEEIYAVLEADTAHQHIWGDRANVDWSVVECSNAADALISDVSSVVSDFLQSEKPYAMMSMSDPVEVFQAEFSVAETGYVILGDLSNFHAMLDDMLGPDPLAEARSARKRYVLGDFTGQESAEAFADFVRELAGYNS